MKKARPFSCQRTTYFVPSVWQIWLGIMNEGRLVMQRSHSELVDEDLEKLYVHYIAGAADLA